MLKQGNNWLSRHLSLRLERKGAEAGPSYARSGVAAFIVRREDWNLNVDFYG